MFIIIIYEEPLVYHWFITDRAQQLTRLVYGGESQLNGGAGRERPFTPIIDKHNSIQEGTIEEFDTVHEKKAGKAGGMGSQ